MTQSPCLPDLPDRVQLNRGIEHSGIAIVGYTADQMNAHYLKGYEAGSAAAAQAVPGDWLFRTKVADLLHLLNFASIEAPTSGDSGQARRIMDELRAMLAAPPTQGAEGAASQAVGHVDYPALEGPLEELVRYCNNDDMLCNASEVIAAEAALETVYKARIAAQCVCQACKNGTIHASDCSVHGSDSGSGIARGPCDCGAALTPSPTPTAPQEAAEATGKQALQVAQEADALREALAELVACKDLKEQLEAMSSDTDPAEDCHWFKTEYERRKPLAWAAARAALAQHQPQQGEQHE